MINWLERLQTARAATEKTLTMKARERLELIRQEHGMMLEDGWLGLFEEAHAAAVATFDKPAHHPLKDYRAHYVEGQEARVVAAHTLTLMLWAEVRRQGTAYGEGLEAACEVCGLDADYLPRR